VKKKQNKPAKPASTPRQRVIQSCKKNKLDLGQYFLQPPSGNAKNIAFITGMLTPFVMSVYSGLEQAAYRTGRYSFIISHFTTFNEERGKNEVLEKIVREKNTCCLIMMTEWPSIEYMAEFRKQRVPVILLEKKMDGAHCITVDNFKGAYEATEYLIKKGRKKIALIRGESGQLTDGDTTATVPNERQNGYMAALSDNGILFDQRLVYYVYHHIKDEGYEAYTQMKRDRADCDAVFCAAGDLVAAGFIEMARIEKRRVPEDMAVVGFDDIMYGQGSEGELTTVRQPGREMGAEAFKIADEAIKGNLKEFKNIVFAPKLIIRDTA
jgi:LacI family transcriptional regulator